MTGENKASGLRICKKCLVRDFDEGELFASIKDYVERLPEDIRTPDAEYERRLNICETCDKLLSGTCKVCGCYVEMRAAAKANHCPDTKEYW